MSDFDGAIGFLYDTAEFYRRLASVVDRGIGQPASAQPDLSRFYGLEAECTTNRVEEIAGVAEWIVNDPKRAAQLGDEAVAKVRRLASTLRQLAPDMAEWEAFDPPPRFGVWGVPTADFDYPGSGYTDLAGKTLNRVAPGGDRHHADSAEGVGLPA